MLFEPSLYVINLALQLKLSILTLDPPYFPYVFPCLFFRTAAYATQMYFQISHFAPTSPTVSGYWKHSSPSLCVFPKTTFPGACPSHPTWPSAFRSPTRSRVDLGTCQGPSSTQTPIRTSTSPRSLQLTVICGINSSRLWLYKSSGFQLIPVSRVSLSLRRSFRS